MSAPSHRRARCTLDFILSLSDAKFEHFVGWLYRMRQQARGPRGA